MQTLLVLFAIMPGPQSVAQRLRSISKFLESQQDTCLKIKLHVCGHNIDCVVCFWGYHTGLSWGMEGCVARSAGSERARALAQRCCPDCCCLDPRARNPRLRLGCRAYKHHQGDAFDCRAKGFSLRESETVVHEHCHHARGKDRPSQRPVLSEPSQLFFESVLETCS